MADRTLVDSHAVGFAPNAEEAAAAPAAFQLGGFMVAVQRFTVVEDSSRTRGSCTSRCTARCRARRTPKVWELRWNVTNDVPERANGVPVTLRMAQFPS